VIKSIWFDNEVKIDQKHDIKFSENSMSKYKNS